MSKFVAIMFLFPMLMAGALAYADAEKQIRFNYKTADIHLVLADYSKASGQRMIIDPQVRGTVTILNPGPISLNEAFNQLCSALAINSLSYTDHDGVMTIKQSRAIQRDLIPLVTEMPPIRPERQVTWIITLKYISADEVNKQLRILTSKDGELVPYTETNQLIVSDYTPNLNRIGAIIKALDTPESAAYSKQHPPLPHAPLNEGDKPKFKAGG